MNLLFRAPVPDGFHHQLLSEVVGRVPTDHLTI
jgi:hypothetical protein